MVSRVAWSGDGIVKIYELPVPEVLRPASQGFIWPPDSNDYNVELDWHHWLRLGARRDLDFVTDDPDEADWYYWQPYWNRWYWQNPDDRHIPEKMQPYIDEAVSGREGRVFTIAEYGIAGEHPEWNLDGLVVFTASRRGDTSGIDIPLLLNEHELRPNVPKQHLASFAGCFINDAVRWHVWDALKDYPDVHFSDRQLGIRDYTALMQASYIVLAPRGVGVQSFRFYEAMQAGTVPLLISDIDSRPFKKWVDWDSCSLYLPSHEGIYEYMNSFSLQELVLLGKNAQRVWYEQLQYGRWCKYVIWTLEDMG
jgi:hypothetical protein